VVGSTELWWRVTLAPPGLTVEVEPQIPALEPRTSNPKAARVWALAVAFVVLIVAVFRASDLPLLPSREVLGQVEWAWLGLALGAFLVSMNAKYARIFYLVRPFADIPFGRCLRIGAIAGALVTLLPLRLGEFARPALLREKGKVSGWHLTSTVAVERIFDGVAFGATLLVGLWLAPPHEPLPDRIGNLPVPVHLVPVLAYWLTAGFAGLLLFMAAAYLWQNAITVGLERTLGHVSLPLAARVGRLVASLVEGVSFLKHGRLSIPYLALTAIHILSHVFALEWLGFGVGLSELTFAESVTLVGCLAIGFALPNAPGFFGAVQLALYAGLGLYIAPERILAQGAALTSIFYCYFLVSVLAFALIALFAEYGPKGLSLLFSLGRGTTLDP
jgi:glycosyltransferase 2 family protein